MICDILSKNKLPLPSLKKKFPLAYSSKYKDWRAQMAILTAVRPSEEAVGSIVGGVGAAVVRLESRQA